MRTLTISKPLGVLLFALAAPLVFASGWGFFVDDLLIGSDVSNADNPFIQPQDPALSGGGRDQTQQFSDILSGGNKPDVLIGRLGVDVMFGGRGADVLIGGTEHFNPQNRDKAFGGRGNDAFLWSPGDGSDFFDGGRGQDTVVLGLMGELDAQGDLFFGVTTDQQAGNVFIDPNTNLPVMDLVNSPGFCRVIDSSSSCHAAAQLEELGVDHLVQFVIRGLAQSFADGTQNTDNGLRVTLSLKNVEYLVCTSEAGGEIEVLDLTVSPPALVSASNLPARVATIVFGDDN